MRGVYTVDIKLAAFNSIKGALLLQAPALKAVEIISAHLGNVGTNVTNQQLEAALSRVATLGSPVGTAITPNPEEVGDQPAGTTVTGGLTTDVTAVGVNVDHQGFASLAGYQFVPVPEERPLIPPGGAAVLRLVVAPGVPFDAVVQVRFREIG
ncbi:MAG: hypothetical protein JSS02_18315 [Planctomycetes bacterium]|nr:hypothetical protein [Planctomycetota bacterium]